MGIKMMLWNTFCDIEPFIFISHYTKKIFTHTNERTFVLQSFVTSFAVHRRSYLLFSHFFWKGYRLINICNQYFRVVNQYFFTIHRLLFGDSTIHTVQTINDVMSRSIPVESNPNPKFLGTPEADFVCHIGPIFQISLVYAFIGCPQSMSQSISLKGYGSTQDVIDGPHCISMYIQWFKKCQAREPHESTHFSHDIHILNVQLVFFPFK